MEEDITILPLGDWWYALQYASGFEMEQRRYPGPTGKLIQKIILTKNGQRAFTIVYEDGSTRKFVAEE